MKIRKHEKQQVKQIKKIKETYQKNKILIINKKSNKQIINNEQ